MGLFALEIGQAVTMTRYFGEALGRKWFSLASANDLDPFSFHSGRFLGLRSFQLCALFAALHSSTHARNIFHARVHFLGIYARTPTTDTSKAAHAPLPFAPPTLLSRLSWLGQ
jgi:hypothetical protein